MSSLIDFFISFLCSLFGVCADEPCRIIDHAEVEHIVCTYDVRSISVALHLRDENRDAYRSLSRLNSALNVSPKMLMNGGMYHHDLEAVGLYIENGKQIQSISTKGGWGNFHLLPNGVFWTLDGEIGVTETKAFIKSGIKPEFATQSGPMLVIDGKLHPRFLKDSDSLKIRNGVGISDDGTKVHFAISRNAVRFWDFGNLFKDRLEAQNALFLDGTVSAIRSKNFRQGGWRDLGPIISIMER